ncbi:hypothetical protein OAF54_02150 [bacterium]|nr:hypothetical protein [bacterium]
MKIRYDHSWENSSGLIRSDFVIKSLKSRGYDIDYIKHDEVATFKDSIFVITKVHNFKIFKREHPDHWEQIIKENIVIHDVVDWDYDKKASVRKLFRPVNTGDPIEMTEAADYICCGCENLKNNYETITDKPLHFIEDYSVVPFVEPRQDKALNIVWFGSNTGWNYTYMKERFFDPIARSDLNVNFKVVTNTRLSHDFSTGFYYSEKVKIEYIEWNRDDWTDHLETANICVIPIPEKNQFTFSKGHVRILDSIRNGLYTIAGYLPAYEKFYNFSSISEEIDIVKELKYYIENQEECIKKVKAGQTFIKENYNFEVVVDRWQHYFETVYENSINH